MRPLTILVAVALVAAACGGATTTERTATPEPTPRLGSFDRPVVLAAVPFGDRGKIQAGVSAVAGALERATGLIWKVSAPTSYAATVEAMCAGQIDVAFLAPLAFALAADRCGVDVVLASKFGQDLTYKGQILVRADSGITDIKGLKGKRFAFVDPLSASGTLYPSLLVKQKGGEDPKTFFSETIFAGGHPQAIIALYLGQVDGAASYIDARDDKSLPADVKEKTRVIDTTPPIPNDNISVRKGFPPELRTQIQQALLDYAGTDAGKKVLRDTFGIDGYGAVDNSFYESVREAVRSSGADLAPFASRTPKPPTPAPTPSP